MTVRVKAPPPASAELGLRPEITGTGLLMVKVTWFEPVRPVEDLNHGGARSGNVSAVIVAVRLVTLYECRSSSAPVPADLRICSRCQDRESRTVDCQGESRASGEG